MVPAAAKRSRGAERAPLFSLLKKSRVTDYQILKRVTPDRRLVSRSATCCAQWGRALERFRALHVLTYVLYVSYSGDSRHCAGDTHHNT